MYPVKLYQNLLLKMMTRRKIESRVINLENKKLQNIFQPNYICRIIVPSNQKKIRKKRGVSILIFIINKYKNWLSVERVLYQKQLEFSFFKNVVKIQSVPFPSYITK